jgi:hypothetical protein
MGKPPFKQVDMRQSQFKQFGYGASRRLNSSIWGEPSVKKNPASHVGGETENESL